MNTETLKSGIYQGTVRHRRFQPKGHEFTYSVFMMYLDLEELDVVFSLNRFWSMKPWRLARFNRNDYFGDPNINLDSAIKTLVNDRIGRSIDGPIRMLTNLRYFGFIINPITIYYCFDKGEQLQAMVLEVTNTPWKERIQYVLDCDPRAKTQRIEFNKSMHVSPFHPMHHVYDWASSTPDQKIAVHMKNRELNDDQKIVFDATLSLTRTEITTSALTKILIQHPFMTMKVGLSIYWQALKIAVKGIPFYSHPDNEELKKP